MRTDQKSVVLRIAYSNKGRAYFSTGVAILLSDFNKKSLEKPVFKSNPDRKTLNHQVSMVLDRINEIVGNLHRDQVIPTAQQVEFLFHKNKHDSDPGSEDPLITDLFSRPLKS